MRTFDEDMNIDTTISKKKEDFFLSPCDEEDYGYEYGNHKDKKIQIAQFPKGKKLSLNEEIILKINLKNKYRFTYISST